MHKLGAFREIATKTKVVLRGTEELGKAFHPLPTAPPTSLPPRRASVSSIC